MMNTATLIMAEGSTQPIPTDSWAIIISLIVLIVSVIGWGVVYFLNIKATNVDRKNNFQLKVYENLLDRSNALIKIISSYTTDATSHTNAMAKILNEYRSYTDSPDSLEKIDATHKLKIAWLDASHKLGEQGFKMQYAIEDYMRYLDMNGTDFTRGTVVYDSLLKIKIDAYDAADRNRKRWSDHKEMDTLTPARFTKISTETKSDADIVSEFGMCVEDVLTIIFNQSISSVLSKPAKQISQSDSRRIITKKGAIDNRKSGNQVSNKKK